jgi:hypothetical protein
MDDVQKFNNCINAPSLQTSYLYSISFGTAVISSLYSDVAKYAFHKLVFSNDHLFSYYTDADT